VSPLRISLQGKLLLFLTAVIIAMALACGLVAYHRLQVSLERETLHQMATLMEQTERLALTRIEAARANVEIFTSSGGAPRRASARRPVARAR
jgi:uncharacterized protein HemX